MKIDKEIENGKARYALVGRMDSNAVSNLQRELDADMDSINYLTLHCYIINFKFTFYFYIIKSNCKLICLFCYCCKGNKYDRN